MKEVEAPGARLSGSARPVVEKPAPLMLLWEIVSVAVPEFVSVTVCVYVEPTGTFPNAAILGCTESCG